MDEWFRFILLCIGGIAALFAIAWFLHMVDEVIGRW